MKVLDFGISKAVLVGPSGVDMSSNHTSSIMGSPYYMSPEQLRSTRTVDHRADVWSLGVVLFELLTGTTIFDEHKEFTELVADILESPHRKLCDFRPDAPPALQAIIDRCLEKDRAKRFQNTAELAVALLPFAHKRARISAERTTSISRAAGLITDPAFKLPPSNYPPAGGTSDSYPSGMLSPPGVPRDLTPATVEPSMRSTPGSLAAGALESRPAPRKQVPVVALLLGAVLLLGVGVGLAYGIIRSLRPTVVAAQPTDRLAPPNIDTAPTAVNTTTTLSATASTVAPTTSTVTVANTTTSTARTPRVTANTTHPTATVTATAATSAPTHPSLDIQLTR